VGKHSSKRFSVAAVRNAEAQRLGLDTLELETEDGQVFSFPAPGFWPDEAKKSIKANDDIGCARALLGAAKYQQFVLSGGRADDVLLALKAFAEDQGIDLGK
jgi:hypothetical protein